MYYSIENQLTNIRTKVGHPMCMFYKIKRNILFCMLMIMVLIPNVNRFMHSNAPMQSHDHITTYSTCLNIHAKKIALIIMPFILN